MCYNTDMKTCTNCQQEKPLDDYYKEKRVADGRQAQCKECMQQRRREYRKANPSADKLYYQANREKLLTNKKLAYATNDERRQAYQETMRQYYLKNQEEIKVKVQIYAEANKKKLAEYRKIYRSKPENIERSNEGSRRYRAKPENRMALAHRQMRYAYRKLNAKGFSTKQQLQWRWDYYGGKCWVCECDATEFDHVIPLTKGGSNWPANLRPICRSCNARKSNTWPYNPKPLLQGVQ